MRMGNLLIYSAADDFYIWPPALPRCRPYRASHGRKPIRRGRCASSSPFLQAKQPTPSPAWWVNRCRSGSGSHSSLRTERVPAATSAPKALRATPDGYTLLLVGVSNAMNATLYQKLNFNFIHDIAPVASIGGALYVMVINPSVPAKTVPEFIAYAKANPGKVNMGSSGSGSVSHVFGERFKMMTGINLVHVPYRGGYVPDLLSGQVQVVFGTISSCIQYIRGGMLRALAVTTATRSDVLPDIPTLAEFVPGYEAIQWYGVGAPKETPAEVIDKLNNEINAIAADPLIKARLAGLGVDPMSMTSATFGKFIADETEKWGNVIRALNIKAE